MAYTKSMIHFKISNKFEKIMKLGSQYEKALNDFKMKKIYKIRIKNENKS